MDIGMAVFAVGSIPQTEAMLRLVEDLGLDSVWVPDHLMGIVHPKLWPELPAAKGGGPAGSQSPDPDAWLDPFCVATVLARDTQLSIGTCVTDSARRRAADLARAAFTIHNEAPGGFRLGIGIGEAMSVTPFGYSFDKPTAALEQALTELRSLFDTGRMPSGCGRTGLRQPSPNRPPEIWVAANAPRGLRLAGQHGDGWLSVSATTRDAYREQLDRVHAAADAAGRRRPTPGLVPLVMLGRSRSDVAAVFEEIPLLKLVLLLAPGKIWSRYGLTHPAGANCRGFADMIPHELDPEELRRIAPRIPMDMVEDFIWVGNADELANRLEPFVELGARQIVLSDLTAFGHSAETSAELLPQFRDLADRLRAMVPPAEAARPGEVPVDAG
jgi:phthiodiolone/phenolphthiodiolone dimycocerosates ketoreductase